MFRAWAKFWPRKCEVPACSALPSCIIASMRVGGDRAGEALVLRLLAGDHRHGQHVLGEGRDRPRASAWSRRGASSPLAWAVWPSCQRNSAVRRNSRGAHLPAHDVGPLVDQHRQVAVALDPALVGVADDGLGCRPHDQRLLQLRLGIDAAACRRSVFSRWCVTTAHLLGEALDVLGLLGEEAQRDEQREIGVLVAGLLEAAGRASRCIFSQIAVAPRLDDHAAAHAGCSPPGRPRGRRPGTTRERWSGCRSSG